MNLEPTVDRSDSHLDQQPLVKPGSHRSRAGSLGAALADQGAQSLVNLTLSLTAARALDATDFGRFSVLFVVLTITWGFIRALVTEPFLVRFSALPSRTVASQLSPLARLFGLVVGPLAIAGAVTAALTSNGWRTSAIFFTLVLPLVAALEAVRAINLASNRSLHLWQTGALWVSSFGLAALLITATSNRLVPILVAYGICLALVAGFGAVRIGPSSAAPSIDRRGLLRQGFSLGAEFLVTASTVNLLVVVVAVVAGLEESAGLRGAMVLAGPITTLMGGLRLGFLADATRHRDRHGDRRWLGYAARMSAGLLAIGSVVAIGIGVVAQQWGETILGDTWTYTDRALLPFLLAALLTSTHLTAASILRARELADRALGIRLLTTPTSLFPAIIGAVVDGAAGASVGFLIGVAVAAPIWLRAAVRHGQP